MIIGEPTFDLERCKSDNQYRLAVAREHNFVAWLDGFFSSEKIRYADETEQRYDIDLFTGQDDKPVSFKYTAIVNRTGKIGFELQVYHKHFKDWIGGNYKTGQASRLVYEWGGRYYLIYKEELNEYVGEHGWDEIVGLSPMRRSFQQKINHPHSDAKIGLIKVEKLGRILRRLNNSEGKAFSNIAQHFF